MKITHISVRNFGRIGAVDIDVQPMLLVAGPNGFGKSYLCDAIKFAFLGDPGRAENKKNLHLLVHRGAQDGVVEIRYDNNRECLRDVATGKAIVGEPLQLPPALPYVLDAGAFAAMDQAARRSFLFGLMGLSLGLDEIAKRLLVRGSTTHTVDAVRHLLPGGFAPALTQAERWRADAKAKWEEVTGERYGLKKAESWVAAKPAFDQAQLDELRNDIKGWEAHVGKLNQQVGELKAAQKARDELPALREKALGHAAAAAKLKKLRKEYQALKDAQDKLPKPQAELLGNPPAHPVYEYECPHCKAKDLLALKGNVLVVHVPAAAKPNDTSASIEERMAAKARREQLQSDTAKLSRDIAIAEKEVAEADAAAVLVSKYEDKPISPDLASAPHRLKEAQGDLLVCREEESILVQAQRQSQEADNKTRRAGQHHADVSRWDKLCQDLSPNGLPAEIMRDALGPLREQLKAAAAATGWVEVEIGEDMAVSWNGFPYKMLGESHQLRVDVMLAVSIAILSGLKLVLLDRADAIVGADRSWLLGWLRDLCDAGTLDTAIVFMAMPKQPEPIDGVQVHWLIDQEAKAEATE